MEYKKEAKQKNAAGEWASARVDTLQKHLETPRDWKEGTWIRIWLSGNAGSFNRSRQSRCAAKTHRSVTP
jgi:hypothetical protein